MTAPPLKLGYVGVDCNETAPLRDTDGVVLGLYHQLWKKNDKGQSCSSVLLPHTIVYTNSTAAAWYFSSKDGQLVRKHSANMTGPLMAEAFMSARDERMPLCAWFTGDMGTAATSAASKLKSKAAFTYEDEDDASAVDPVPFSVFEYEKVSGLLDPGPYRLVPEQVDTGVLQRFVEPREVRDFVMRASWSPSSCVFERRTNRDRLVTPEWEQEPRTAPKMTDRVASFHAPLWQHEHTTLLGHCAMSAHLQAACDGIASHLRNVSGGATRIARMELIFKVDVNNKIWLLLCSLLRLERLKGSLAPLAAPGGKAPPARASPAVAPVTKKIRDPTKAEEVALIEEETGTFVCAFSGEVAQRRDRVQVTYKHVMSHWFATCTGLACESDRIAALDDIPPAIRRANPNLTREFYLRYRSQPFFLFNTLDVSPASEEQLNALAFDELTANLGHAPSRHAVPAGSCGSGRGSPAHAGTAGRATSSGGAMSPGPRAVMIPLGTGRISPSAAPPLPDIGAFLAAHEHSLAHAAGARGRAASGFTPGAAQAQAAAAAAQHGRRSTFGALGGDGSGGDGALPLLLLCASPTGAKAAAVHGRRATIGGAPTGAAAGGGGAATTGAKAGAATRPSALMRKADWTLGANLHGGPLSPLKHGRGSSASPTRDAPPPQRNASAIANGSSTYAALPSSSHASLAPSAAAAAPAAAAAAAAARVHHDRLSEMARASDGAAAQGHVVTSVLSMSTDELQRLRDISDFAPAVAAATSSLVAQAAELLAQGTNSAAPADSSKAGPLPAAAGLTAAEAALLAEAVQ
ncbi:hypothetical protein FOA52_005347 [Chlamydomonas sp. UWO 241]|nr:hypothetical protein FOA52_005347 [Chlamydomonas sp. UWO 241]